MGRKFYFQVLQDRFLPIVAPLQAICRV
jgi:hypothetical protein